MGTKVSVGGKFVTRPGVYTTIKSGVQQAAAQNPYGNICVIDDGTFGATWGSGAGVSGTGSSGVSAVAQITDPATFQSWVRGGQFYQLASAFFNPYKNVQGASKVYFIRAAETTPSTGTLTLASSSVILTTVAEGICSVGVEESTNLTRGYAFKLIAGSKSGKFQFVLYRGTYAGFDAKNGVEIVNTKAASKPEVVLLSPNFTTYYDLVHWMLNDAGFAQQLKVTQVGSAATLTTINTLINGSTGSTTLITGDISSDYVLTTGGTESYTSNAFTAAIETSRGLPINFYFAPQHGVNAVNTSNVNLFNLVDSLTGPERFIVMGGGNNSSTLFGTTTGNSQATAQYYNNSKVIVVHGDFYLPKFGGGFLQYDAYYKAAYVLGRLAGLQPQVPLTFKALPMVGESSSLSETDQSNAIDFGILCTYYNQELGTFVVLEDVNTLQDNLSVVTSSGDSYLIQLKRIESQLIRDLTTFMTRRFFSGEGGPNRSTINPADVKTATFDYLKTKTVDAETDNLIIWGGNVQVTQVQDNTYVDFDFQPNLENTKIIITGTLVLEH